MTAGAETSTVGEPSRRLYFGWRVALAMSFVTAAVYGVTVYGFIILARPIAEEHGWSAAQTGSLVSAMWLVAPLALFCAPLIQRAGPWRLLAGGLMIEAVAVAALGLVSEFWQLYLLRIAMGIGKVFAIVSMPVIVSRWFSRRFGTAIALAWCGGSVGGITLAPLTEVLVHHLGWKSAALVLSAGVVGACVLILSLGRGPKRPADLGLELDGVKAKGASTAPGRAGPAPQATKIGWREIRTINPLTACFMAFGVAASGAGAIAFMTQAPALLEAGGYSATAAAALLGLTAGGSLAGQLLVGWSLDRFKPAWNSIGLGLLILIGLLAFYLLPLAPTLIAAAAAALVFGAGTGASEVFWITLTKRQFGTALFALTYGGWNFAFQVGYATGGGIGGWTFEQVGAGGFLSLIALLFVPSILFGVWRPGAPSQAADQAPEPDA